jgi:hypothetical protein
LFPEDTRLYRPQKHDEFKSRNIHAGCKHVHADHDLGIWPVAKLTDTLQRPVHVGIAGDLLHKRIALLEYIPADFDQLIGM